MRATSNLNLGASLACTPLGKTYRVTAVRDNILAELDGRRAFDVFAEAAGPLADDLKRAVAFVFLGIPLDPEAEQMERGRYLVRNIVGASTEHGVLAVAHRPKIGDRVGFALRNGERAREDLKATLEEMQRRVAAAARPLVFTSIACRAARRSTTFPITTRPTSAAISAICRSRASSPVSRSARWGPATERFNTRACWRWSAEKLSEQTG